jgi:FAD dependent oxidoreductase TIGR03364
MANHYDLIIVGGGILGTFHAYHALPMGLRVALLERHSQPQGATVRNFGQVVPSGMNATWQRLGRESLRCYQRIQEKFDISVRKNGTVYIASDEEEMTLLEELATINKSTDYPSHLLTAQLCLARYEGLRPDYCRGGLFFPEEITVEPRIAVHRIRQYLIEQEGLAYFPDTLTVDIQPRGEEYVVAASDGRTFRASRVVVCSGSEFKTLYPELFAQSNLQAVKIHMLQTVPQPAQRIPGSVLTGLSIRRYESFAECPSYPTIKSREAPDSLVKKWGIHILFKQATDGSVIIGDSHEYADAARADQLGFDLDEEINRYILEEASRIFELQDWRLQRSWYGIYSQCAGAEIFQHRVDRAIHIVTGIGGKGMTGGPGFAQQHLTEIIGNPLNNER